MKADTDAAIEALGKNRTVDWPIAKQYLKVAVPFAVLGSVLVPFAPEELLLVLFGSFVILYGAFLLYRFGLFPREDRCEIAETEEKVYAARAAAAGFLTGLIATGTGKIIISAILKHCKIRSPAEAVGTTIVIIFVVNLCAVLFRLTPDFISTLTEQKNLVISIMIWVAPGVIIGGQIGPDVAKKLSKRGIRIYVGILLIFVGILINLRFFSGF